MTLKKRRWTLQKITADENKKLFEEADAMVLEQAKFEEEQVDKKMKNLEDYYAEQAYLARENIGLFSTNAKEREKQGIRACSKAFGAATGAIKRTIKARAI